MAIFIMYYILRLQESIQLKFYPSRLQNIEQSGVANCRAHKHQGKKCWLSTMTCDDLARKNSLSIMTDGVSL